MDLEPMLAVIKAHRTLSDSMIAQAKRILSLRGDKDTNKYEDWRFETVDLIEQKVRVRCEWYTCSETDYVDASFPVHYLEMTDEEVAAETAEERRLSKIAYDEKERVKKEDEKRLSVERRRATYEELKKEFEFNP